MLGGNLLSSSSSNTPVSPVSVRRDDGMPRDAIEYPVPADLRLPLLLEQLLKFSNQIHLPDDLTLLKLQLRK